MVRVKSAPARHKRKKRLLKRAKGGRGARSKLYRTAVESVRRGEYFSYRDRKAKKRSFRSLWIARINAQVKNYNLSYSKFINGLKRAKVALNRKILAELAVNDKLAFGKLVEIAKKEKPEPRKEKPTIKKHKVAVKKQKKSKK